MSGAPGSQPALVADGSAPEAPEEAAYEAYENQTQPAFGQAQGAGYEEGFTSVLARRSEQGQAPDADPVAKFLNPFSSLPNVATPFQAWGSTTAPESQKLSPEEINHRFAPEGTTITDHPMTPELGAIIGRQTAEKMRRDQILQRFDNTYSWPTRFGTGMANFMLDPLQAATAFVPGPGEGAILAHLGYEAAAPLMARIGARAASGFAGGALAQAPLSAARLGLANDVDDYDLRQGFLDMMFAGGMNSLIHSGIGGLREAGVFRPDEIMAREPASAPMITAPPQANYDAMRTALGQVLDERPVEVQPIYDEAVAGGAARPAPDQAGEAPADVAESQRRLYSEGYAAGMPEGEFRAANTETYGDTGAAEPEAKEAKAPIGETKAPEGEAKTPEEQQLADLEAKWAEVAPSAKLTPEERAELDQSKAALQVHKLEAERVESEAKRDQAVKTIAQGFADPATFKGTAAEFIHGQEEAARNRYTLSNKPQDMQGHAWQGRGDIPQGSKGLNLAVMHQGQRVATLEGWTAPGDDTYHIDYADAGGERQLPPRAVRDLGRQLRDGGLLPEGVTKVEGWRVSGGRGRARQGRVFQAVTDGTRFKPDVVDQTARLDLNAFEKTGAERLGFYSGLQRAVEGLQQARATGEQWLATLKNRPGVKGEEIEATGLGEFLEEHKGEPVTKEQVLQHLRDHGVQLQEVVSGGKEDTAQRMKGQAIQAREDFLGAMRREGYARDEAEDLERDGKLEGVFKAFPHIREIYERAEHLMAESDRLSGLDEGEDFGAEPGAQASSTRFEEYTLPGGTNYREMKLTLPPTKNELQSWKVIRPDGHVDATYSSESGARSAAGIIGGTVERGETKILDGGFRSSHFPEPNILAHARLKDRVGPNGEKILHVEELQSDWHQKGRREGYAPKDRDAAARAALEAAGLKAEHNGMNWVIRTKDGRGVPNKLIGETKVETGHNGREHTVFAADLAQATAMATGERSLMPTKIPDAPFKKTWHELLLKRLIAKAAAEGYDKIAWSPGDVHIDRYNLEKHVSRIKVVEMNRHPNATYSFEAFHKDDPNRVISQEHNLTANQLVEHIGKSATDRALEKIEEGKKRPVPYYAADLRGEDLRVGSGSGMRGFYDKIVPDFLNRYGKKFGAKVGTTSIDAGEFKVNKDSHETLPYRLEKKDSPDILARFKTGDEAWAEAERRGATKLPSIDITPQMREEVAKGQPLFEKPGAERAGQTYNLETQPLTAEERDRTEQLRTQMQALVDKIAPGYGTKVFAKMGTETPEGTRLRVTGGVNFLRKIISYSLESRDIPGTVRHEALHALREAGAFSDHEWATLEEAARTQGWLDKFYGTENTIHERYAHLDEAGRLEEAIAEEVSKGRHDLYAGYAEPVRAILLKIHDFFAQVGETVRRLFGQDATAQDIMRQIERGQIGDRMVEPVPSAQEAVGAEGEPQAQAAQAEVASPTAPTSEPGERDPREEQARQAAIQARTDALRNALVRHRQGAILQARFDAEGADGALNHHRDMFERVQNHMSWLTNQAQSILMSEVRLSGHQNEALSGQNDLEYGRKLYEMSQSGKDFSKTGIDRKATGADRVTQALKGSMDYMKARLNNAGARIGTALDYVSHTNHDPRMLRLAAGKGATLEAARAAWIKDALQYFSPKTYEDIEPKTITNQDGTTRLETPNETKQRFLSSVYDSRVSGVSLGQPQLSGMASDGEGNTPLPWDTGRNIAKGFSHQRIIHFNGPDDWVAYQKKYSGARSILHQVNNALSQGARGVALMEELGTNASYNLESVWRSFIENNRTHPDIEKFRVGIDGQFANPGLRTWFSYIDGTANMPKNEMAAKRAAALSGFFTYIATTKLGSVGPTHFFGTIGTYPAMMARHGVNHLEALYNMGKALLTPRGPEERQRILGALGAYNHGFQMTLRTLWQPRSGVPGVIASGASRFMKLTGLPFLLDKFQSEGVLSYFTNKFSNERGKAFNELDPHETMQLRRYGIGQSEWDLLRNAPEQTVDENGTRYLTPKAADVADEAQIETLLRQRGIIPADADAGRIGSEVQNFKWRLGDAYGMFLNDAREQATVTPGPREQSAMLRGAEPGTVDWFVKRALAQFKAWPIAAYHQTWAKTFADAMSTREAYTNIGMLIGLSMIGGAGRMALQDFAVGRPQRDYRDPRTLLAAAAQGGGLGIYADFLFGETNRMGGGLVATAGGPVTGDLDQLERMREHFMQDLDSAYKGQRHGGKDWETAFHNLWPDLANLVRNHIPYANLVYLKGALDYMLWYHLEEAVSPGWWRRTNQRLEKEQGRTMLGYTPGGGVPWGVPGAYLKTPGGKATGLLAPSQR